MEEIFKIKRNGWLVLVKRMRVSELDKSKCSKKFLEHDLSDDTIVNVKCYPNGDLDLRGKRNEYRILLPNSK